MEGVLDFFFDQRMMTFFIIFCWSRFCKVIFNSLSREWRINMNNTNTKKKYKNHLTVRINNLNHQEKAYTLAQARKNLHLLIL